MSFNNTDPMSTKKSNPAGEADLMADLSESSLTRLADAAFRQAAAKVVLRASQSATPIILWDRDEIRSIPPEEAKSKMSPVPYVGPKYGPQPGSEA